MWTVWISGHRWWCAWAALAAGRLAVTPLMVRRDLAGRDLMCWCPEGFPCHGDVLLEVANSQPEGSTS